MAYNYDQLYGQTPDALGAPTPVFVSFFKQLERENLRVLDIGCGQGRDALFIARQGHKVVGIDIARNGIRDLKAAADREALAVTGIVADVLTYTPDGVFDIILIDRTLHMLAEQPRLSVLKRLLSHVKKEGWMLIADEASNINGFTNVIEGHDSNWTKEFAKQGYLFVRQT